MRIGEINQDNYKQFLQMLGVKSSATLDALMGKGVVGNSGQASNNFGRNYEEGMVIMEGEDASKYNKIVPVSEKIKDKIIATVRRQFLDNGNGMTKAGTDSAELAAIMKDYRRNIPPNERLSVSWTLCQIQLSEQQRLVNYVKSKDPAWKQGQQFDKSILTDTNFGTISKDGVDVKA